jgi:hypothetical protein
MLSVISLLLMYMGCKTQFDSISDRLLEYGYVKEGAIKLSDVRIGEYV